MSIDHMNAHLCRGGSIGYEHPHLDGDPSDACPPHHERFGSIEKCPWCNARRCQMNMGDHISIRHLPDPDSAKEGE